MARQTLRIIHCFRSPIGGIFRHVRDLTKAQVKEGHQVGIICDSNTGGAYEEQLFEGIRPDLALGIHRTPMQRHIGIGDVTAAWRSYHIIKELQPDILHGHGAKGGVYARVFGSLLRVSRSRVARLYSPHGGSLHYDRDTAVGKLFFALEKGMDRAMTDHLLFVSDYERRTFVEKVGEPRSPYSLVLNGLRDSEFVPVPPAPDAADFLYIGMMRDLKGPDIFIEALAGARARLGGEVTAVMVGDGEDLPKYRRQVAALGLTDSIDFRAPMPARQAFAMARTIVVPSRAEAMPYIVLEALAAGMPMIASAVGGIPEIFGPQSRALIAPEPGILAERMAEALQDVAAFRLAMPDEAQLRRRFGVETMAKQIDDVYYQALAADS